MDPLQAIAMPTHGVLVGMTSDNSWEQVIPAGFIYYAFIATNSTLGLSFVSLQTASDALKVVRLASRPAFKKDFQHGVVLELYMNAALAEGEAVYVYLAQAGATVYFPAQAIED